MFDKPIACLHCPKTNPFPEWTSLLCDHRRQCKGHCVLGRRGTPVDFPEIESYLGSHYARPLDCKEANGKKIAIVGAGPAGLACAYYLARNGYGIDVYEKEDGLGGVLLTGIPAFRYAKNGLKGIEGDLARMGIRFHFNEKVDAAKIREFCKDFAKVILCVGAEKENTLGYDAHDGVVGGLSLLYDLVKKQNPEKYASKKKAFVWGGGNVAMDCARSLKRLGLDVSIIYRRGEEEMPAAKDEIESCKEDGVQLRLLTNIKELILDGNALKGAKLLKMELGEKDESGRASFHEIPGSEFEESFDLLVPALGEKIELPIGEEDVQNVLLAGDCKYGARNIASAIKDGRTLAMSIVGEE